MHTVRWPRCGPGGAAARVYGRRVVKSHFLDIAAQGADRSCQGCPRFVGTVDDAGAKNAGKEKFRGVSGIQVNDQGPRGFFLIQQALDHLPQSDEVLVDFSAEVGELLVEFYGKVDKDTTAWQVTGIGEIMIPVVFQEADKLVGRARQLVEATQVFFPPDLSCQTERLTKQLLFVGEMIVEPAF